MTITAVVSQAFGRYCEGSVHPAFAHIWVFALKHLHVGRSAMDSADPSQTLTIEASAVTVAMYCLIQFYIQLKEDLAHHRPFFQVLCIKLVIFFSFWQSVRIRCRRPSLEYPADACSQLLISLLTSTKALEPSDKINYADFKIGIPSMLLCIEMAIFAVMHIYAFSYKDYRISKATAHYEGGGYQGGFLGWKAFLDAYNPWDIISAIGRSFRWLFVGRRTRLDDISYDQHRPDSMILKNTPTETGYVGARPKKDFTSAVGIGPKQGKYQPLQDDDSGDPFADPQGPSSQAHSYASASREGYAGVSLPSSSIDLGDGPNSRWRDEDHLMASHPAPRVGEVIPPSPEQSKLPGFEAPRHGFGASSSGSGRP